MKLKMKISKPIKALFICLTVILVACVAAVVVIRFSNNDQEYYMKHHFVKRRVVKDITGVRFPRYKVVDCAEEWSCFKRPPEHVYVFTLEFDRMPNEEFYKRLEEHFESDEPGKYDFSASWGNGKELPKGETDKYDMIFSVSVKRYFKTFQIRVGGLNNRGSEKDTKDPLEAICDSIVDNDEEMKAIYLKCLDCWERSYRFGDEEAWDSIQYCINCMYALFVERSVGMDSVMKWKLYDCYIFKENDWSDEWTKGEKVCPWFVW